MIYERVVDLIAGDVSVTEAELDSLDRTSTTVVWSYRGALVIAGVAFLIWLWRARMNAEALCPASHRRGRPWVIWGWIVPVINLWFPYQVVDDVYRASRPGNHPELYNLRTVPGSRLLGAWWTAWLAAFAFDRLARNVGDDASTVSELNFAMFLDSASSAMVVAAAVVLIMIMRRVNGWQTRT